MINTLNNIVIVGQGAMGLLWYHHLSQQISNLGNSVNVDSKNTKKVSLKASKQVLIDSNENGEASATYNFTPYLQDKSQKFPLVYSQTQDIASADVILLCVKSYQIAEVIKSLTKQLASHCIVILAHNGMGTFEEVAKLMPAKQRIMAMLTTHGCLRQSPLTIKHTGLGQSDIGLLSGELSTAEKTELTDLLNQALPDVNFHQDIAHKQWLKLAINCVINPLTAVNNINNGKVNNSEYTAQTNALIAEVVEISTAEGHPLVYSELQSLVTKVALATAQNSSSMRCDTQAGKQTEIDYINGYIHRLGVKHGIATPENTRLWQQVKRLSDV